MSGADEREALARMLFTQEWPDLDVRFDFNRADPDRFYKRADAILAAGYRPGSKVAALTAQLQAAQARADEAESILIRVVQQANTHAVDGDDGFIAAYHMPVGPVHAAIPFLQRRGVYVDVFGGVHRAASIEQTEAERG